MKRLKRGDLYRAYNGDVVEIIGSGIYMDLLKRVVIYKTVGVDDPRDLYVRNIDEFFKEVDIPKIGYKGPRFILITKE